MHDTAPRPIDRRLTERLTVEQARRAPRWQRLFTSIDKAGRAKGWEGRYFGDDEVASFGITFVGYPQTVPAPVKGEFAVYWVERHASVPTPQWPQTHVTYLLKCARETDFSVVENVAEERVVDPSPDADLAMSLDLLRRAAALAGRWLVT